MSEPRRHPISPVRPSPTLLARVDRHLRSGGIVAYPTETVYGFGSLVRAEPLQRLFELKERDVLKPVLLLINEDAPAEGLAWPGYARRLVRRFWPGPLTLILPDPGGLYPPGVRGGAGGVAVRMSPHPLVEHLLARLREPLTSTSANLAGEDPARSGEEALDVARRLGGGDDVWILDGGALAVSPPSTVIDCTGPEPLVRRRGAVPSAEIFEALEEDLAPPGGREEVGEAYRILFVCTGNTCRSPLAEAITRDLAEQREWALEARSAGAGAAPGLPASPGALRAASRHGLDLAAHESRPVDRELVDWADLVLVMGEPHALRVKALGGQAKVATLRTFATGGEETRAVADPVGGDDEVYEATFRELENLVRRALDRIEPVLQP